ncbi:MAG: zinc-ribbon domain-containing protein [Elusimicrobiota bacterium]
MAKNNSLAKYNSALSRQWHPSRNGELTPVNVTAGSNKKVWWLCKKGHEWLSSINNRTNGNGCPFCSGKAVSTENSLATLNPKLARKPSYPQN